MTNEITNNTNAAEVPAPKFEQVPQLMSEPEPESVAGRVFKRIVWIMVLVVIRVVVHAMFR